MFPTDSITPGIWQNSGIFRILSAFFLGAFAVLTLPPFSLPVVLPISFGGLYLLVVGATHRTAAFLVMALMAGAGISPRRGRTREQMAPSEGLCVELL